MSLKVYYLDDEVALLEIFAEMLEAPGRIIKTFDKIEEALAAIEIERPDILFIDYRLPGQNGDEVARRLDPNFGTVLITGEIQVNPVHKFDAILSKPFKFDQIEATIERLSRERR